ncbi:TP53RK [Lepeophtheirus salmonis]|uniref:non-specific serine/threonine protein kinase n=1 Tax=Lepeophtheirus salmonis TaxID=72036 RepID=A0A7R8D6L8_LEPSM|nr:TP53RK [Lepeophtheirus salmonis]CAF3042268.1 TP53RK [Lepeophtheirus salmonis]
MASSTGAQKPKDFLKQILGRPVLVKLNSGSDYRGVLSCLDGHMNIALEQTEEYYAKTGSITLIPYLFLLLPAAFIAFIICYYGAWLAQGAESRLYLGSYLGKDVIIKHRFSKKYRHPDLDSRLIKEHSKAEVRCLIRCQNAGINTPTIYYADDSFVVLEYLKTASRCRDVVDKYLKANDSEGLGKLAKSMGFVIGNLHKNNIIHGDLTTSNILVDTNGEIYLIDFGLGTKRALLSTHPQYTEDLFNIFLESYRSQLGKQAKDVIKKYEEIRLRGRKRSMEG